MTATIQGIAARLRYRADGVMALTGDQDERARIASALRNAAGEYEQQTQETEDNCERLWQLLGLGDSPCYGVNVPTIIAAVERRSIRASDQRVDEVARLTMERDAAYNTLRDLDRLNPGPYTVEKISPDSDGRTHWRIADGADNRIATCYDEGNARFIALQLNKGRTSSEAPSERRHEDTKRLDVLQSLLDHRGEHGFKGSLSIGFDDDAESGDYQTEVSIWAGECGWGEPWLASGDNLREAIDNIEEATKSPGL